MSSGPTPEPAPEGPVTVLLTPGGVVTGWGAGAARLFGRPAESVLGRALSGLLGPAAAEPLAVALKAAAAGRAWTGALPVGPGAAPVVSCTPLVTGPGRTAVLLSVPPPWEGGLELLNEAGRRIGSTLDLGRTAREILSVVTPRFADAGAIYILERLLADEDPAPPGGAPGAAEADGSAVVRRLAIAFAEDDPREWAERFPVNEVMVYPAGTPYARCLATGRRVEFGGDAVADTVAHVRGRPVPGLLDHVSLLAVPLTARGRALGFAVFSRKRGRLPFSAADAALAEDLAGRAATCVDNACAYRREHRTAMALQAALAPAAVPAPPGLEIAHRYLPARAGVGGDWYDVVPLRAPAGAGSVERVAVVIGDSVGHGVTAAAAMGQLRVAAHTLVTCAFPPRRVLERLDGIAQDLDAAQFATCLCLTVDPASRHCEIAVAGHPPPLLLEGTGGPARPVPVVHGLPLGVADHEHPADHAQASFTLPPGGVLALYTDGLVESRTRHLDAGIARLGAALAAAHAPSLDDTADGILDLLADQRGGDDIALLLLRAAS
ncbi:PP2C family protein-serine/threonine phosphatase [Spirillospora albida]|uniref:PP2C family protein-serine/threonine phosphatase n=1 Tax=Spirillospora albida TaxID=58123 RepID=UPI00068A9DCA|nr:PP2C family protein-serine/threonine phosphatase [Spirillospora albida]